MNNQQQSHHYQHKYQRNYQRQQQPQDRQQSGNPLERRREFLWRERVQLEMQTHALTMRAEGLEQEWRVLQHRKTNLQQQKPKLAVQILLSSLAGMRYLRVLCSSSVTVLSSAPYVLYRQLPAPTLRPPPPHSIFVVSSSSSI
jgi:hypothetical protein